MAATTPAQEREWLIQAQRERNTKAFAKLVTAHQGRVRAVLRKLTHGQQGVADELAQETFIKAWHALPGFRHDAQWNTWLHRIAYLEFLQHVRRNPSQTRQPLEEAHTAEAATNPAHELRLDLEKALTQLQPLETAAIVHCFHGGLSHNQAAEVLGLPLGTLKSHLARGRSKLQVLLADWRPADSP